MGSGIVSMCSQHSRKLTDARKMIDNKLCFIHAFRHVYIFGRVVIREEQNILISINDNVIYTNANKMAINIEKI